MYRATATGSCETTRATKRGLPQVLQRVNSQHLAGIASLVPSGKQKTVVTCHEHLALRDVTKNIHIPIIRKSTMIVLGS